MREAFLHHPHLLVRRECTQVPGTAFNRGIGVSQELHNEVANIK